MTRTGYHGCLMDKTARLPSVFIGNEMFHWGLYPLQNESDYLYVLRFQATRDDTAQISSRLSRSKNSVFRLMPMFAGAEGP